jgi:hypothetical protein
MRLPDRLYALLERVYVAQRRIRRAEDRAELERQDRALRDYADRQRREHQIHKALGKRAEGCPYVPCTPKVSNW